VTIVVEPAFFMLQIAHHVFKTLLEFLLEILAFALVIILTWDIQFANLAILVA